MSTGALSDKRIIAVSRDVRFSPNSVDKDMAILQAVASRLAADYVVVDENRLEPDMECDICLSMARNSATLDILAGMEQRGLVVVNSPDSVRACRRSAIEAVMSNLGVPLPPRHGEDGYWIKRGDMAAQTSSDVRYCRDRDELEAARRDFATRNITDYTFSAHVVGDLIKWYAVKGGFFRYFYPSDDGRSKFGDESHNGQAHHYAFDAEALHEAVDAVARETGIVAYGGDAIVRTDGSFCIIDFNDWPSFSRCRDEAADAIAAFVMRDYNRQKSI